MSVQRDAAPTGKAAESSAAPSPPSDGDLVRDLRTPGDAREIAWTLLVERHAHRLYAVARSFGVDQATAEDLAQLAWLRLIERGGQLRDPAAVGAWLCMIVRNESRRLVTRRREIPTDDAAERLPVGRQHDHHDAADSRLLGTERALAVRAAFARLGGDCQQLLRLVLADPPLSYDEIAVAVGRPRGSLGPTRRRCLQQLRGHLPAGFEP